MDGPFAATKEMVAGFWILQVTSPDEAVEWIKRSPFREGTVEIRRVFEAEDFGDALPREVREAEERMRDQLGGLTTAEIARAFLTPEPTVAQRIVRAKRTLSATGVPFEVPAAEELPARFGSARCWRSSTSSPASGATRRRAPSSRGRRG